MTIDFGDKVKFLDDQVTREAGVAGKEGICVGFTTPSITRIEFIGDVSKDYAISIQLTEDSKIIWVTPNLVEFLNYGAGQIMEVGNIRATRQSDGSWKEELIDPIKEKGNWLTRLFRK
jgi:hypothetical protein